MEPMQAATIFSVRTAILKTMCSAVVLSCVGVGGIHIPSPDQRNKRCRWIAVSIPYFGCQALVDLDHSVLHTEEYPTVS